MVGYKDTPDVAKKLLKLLRKSNNWSMVRFIHNGSETTTWLAQCFKIKQKYKIQSKIRYLTTSFSFWISSCKSLDQQKDTGVVCQLTETTVFVATPMKKYFQQFILPKGVCFVKLLTGKVQVLGQIITCQLEIQACFPFFFLT